jgi:hypothetical protein
MTRFLFAEEYTLGDAYYALRELRELVVDAADTAAADDFEFGKGPSDEVRTRNKATS